MALSTHGAAGTYQEGHTAEFEDRLDPVEFSYTGAVGV